MKINPKSKHRGKLYFQDLNGESVIIELNAEMDGAKQFMFIATNTHDYGKLPLFYLQRFKINGEEYFDKEQYYFFKISSGFEQIITVNEAEVTFISGVFEILQPGIGVIESFKMHGYFARNGVEINLIK